MVSGGGDRRVASAPLTHRPGRDQVMLTCMMRMGGDSGTRVDPRTVRVGLEAEFALVDDGGRLADFRSLPFTTAQAVVDRLDPRAHPALRKGDLGIKRGRWYVEGDERFGDAGQLLDCVPKGVETRTPPAVGIDEAVETLRHQSAALGAAAAADGYRLASIGWNPFAERYRPQPPYSAGERAMRACDPVYLAPDVYMMSYGPDVNLSHPSWDDRDVVLIARRLTALSPVLVPFSFSAPFAVGGRAGPWSIRTGARTGRRPAATAFVASHAVPEQQPSPPLIRRARISAERGRIEFKAFDAVVDPASYPSLVALVVGVALSQIGGIGAAVPDGRRHLSVAWHAFAEPSIAGATRLVLAAARTALRGSGYDRLLDPLDGMLASGRTPAHELVERYDQLGSVPLPLATVPAAP